MQRNISAHFGAHTHNRGGGRQNQLADREEQLSRLARASGTGRWFYSS